MVENHRLLLGPILVNMMLSFFMGLSLFFFIFFYLLFDAGNSSNCSLRSQGVCRVCQQCCDVLMAKIMTACAIVAVQLE